jgi:hypothetical protein
METKVTPAPEPCKVPNRVLLPHRATKINLQRARHSVAILRLHHRRLRSLLKPGKPAGAMPVPA